MTMTILAWAMIIVFLALVMTKKMQPFTALLLVPLVFTLLGAFLGQYTELVAAANEVDAASVTLWDQILIIGDWTVAGVQQTANTGIMLLFAILYFAIMLNAGLFDPVTRAMIRFAKGDPVKVLLGTAIVAACVSLNGDGTTTTLICCTAFIPIYKKLNLKMMNLGVLVILMNTIMNLLPWGGPTARVISVLQGQPGVDDDRNGYVDDIYGFNFTSDNYSGTITAEDHGTHVAGTIAAVNNNGIGVAGIAGGDYAKGKQGVRIMACQTGPGAAYIASAFTYAADNGAVITQNSWGCDPSYTAIFQAIDYFNRYAGQDNGVQVGPMDGGLCIFAAGNSSSSTQDVFPADYEGVMAVASIGADYEIAYYSNYGDWVDITAPGGDAAKRQQILSTIPNNKYGEMQGTSMACPHASGVAALIVSAFGGEGFTRENLWDIMVSGVRDIYEYNPKYEGMLGAGLIDAELCLTSYGPNPPEPVTDLEAVSSTGGSITLQWTVPEDSDSYKPSKAAKH